MESFPLLCSGILALKKPASKGGADKYGGVVKCSEGKVTSDVDMYVPQDISREKSSAPEKELMMKICRYASEKTELGDVDALEGEAIVEVVLTKCASSGGGDRYEGNLKSGVKFTPYVPQCFSRMSKPDRHKKLVVAFKVFDRKRRQTEMQESIEAKKRARVKIEDDHRIETISVIDEEKAEMRKEMEDEDKKDYERVYSAESRRINLNPMKWDTLKEIISNDRLHVLGRSFPQHKSYVSFTKKVRGEWKGVSDYILATKIGVPFKLGEDNKKMVVREDMNSNPEFNGKLFLLENDFPYNLEPGLRHYCLWKIGEVPIVAGGDSCEIRSTMAESGYPPHLCGTKYVFYVNPPHLKSISDIDHAHIIVREHSEDVNLVD